MLAEGLSAPLLATLQRPDLRVLAEGRRIRFDLAEPSPFRLASRADRGSLDIVLGPASTGGGGRAIAFHLRHALERALLLDPDDRDAGVPDAVAFLAAARVAALFFGLDAAPDEPVPEPWLGTLAADAAPDAATLRLLARRLGAPGAALDDAVGLDAAVARIGACWAAIGPVEVLLAAGGDARLRTDPATRLNGYGSAPRPRPWAVTYASSTASSLSERGFAGAEQARRRATRALLGGDDDAFVHELRRARAGIARHYALPPGVGIVLAASGTDCELVALAIVAAARAGGQPVCNVLTAPDETGSGVPLASVGRHFAIDTARGDAVEKGALLDGMPADTVRADLAVRAPNGTLLAPDAVDGHATRLVEQARRDGQHVLLHFLDVSKTGLLAPSIDCVSRLGRAHRGGLSVVVDACQARLNAERVRSYVQVGWTVMITGSKFFTGPPFCGAILVPEPVMAALATARLPDGLALYCGRADWPEQLAAAAFLPGGANAGMALRWQAAFAEMNAFAAVPGARKRAIMERFTASVRDAIARAPSLLPVDAPPLRRPVLGDAKLAWDDLQTIIPFLVLGADGAPLGLAEARRLYAWLNADVLPALPPGLGATERFLASLRCHVGQPAPVADGRGGIAGALRISAGARLVSGEPSHEGIDAEARLAREIADALACLEKLSLLLRHHDRLARLDPKPSYGAPLES